MNICFRGTLKITNRFAETPTHPDLPKTLVVLELNWQ